MTCIHAIRCDGVRLIDLEVERVPLATARTGIARIYWSAGDGVLDVGDDVEVRGHGAAVWLNRAHQNYHQGRPLRWSDGKWLVCGVSVGACAWGPEHAVTRTIEV